MLKENCPWPLSQHNKTGRKYPNSKWALSKSAKRNLRLYLNSDLKEGRTLQKGYHSHVSKFLQFCYSWPLVTFCYLKIMTRFLIEIPPISLCELPCCISFVVYREVEQTLFLFPRSSYKHHISHRNNQGYLIRNFLLLVAERKSGPMDTLRPSLRQIVPYPLSNVLVLREYHKFSKVSNEDFLALCFLPILPHSSHWIPVAWISKFLAHVFPSSFPILTHILLVNRSNNNFKYWVLIVFSYFAVSYMYSLI